LWISPNNTNENLDMFKHNCCVIQKWDLITRNQTCFQFANWVLHQFWPCSCW
jgi:hypothetical protein